jgi:hypothetical protein
MNVDKQVDNSTRHSARAVEYGNGPLLIIAGAGSGKTSTLAHRVADLIAKGADPRRVLLLTFTRRAAAEMIRRAQLIIGQDEQDGPDGSRDAETSGAANIPGRAPSIRSPTGCCACMRPRSGSILPSPCSTARIRRISSICCATSSGSRAPRSAFRARRPALPSTRAPSTRKSRSAPA